MTEWVYKPTELSSLGFEKRFDSETKYLERHCGKYSLTVGVFELQNEFHVFCHFLWNGKEFRSEAVHGTAEEAATQAIAEVTQFVQQRKEKRRLA